MVVVVMPGEHELPTHVLFDDHDYDRSNVSYLIHVAPEGWDLRACFKDSTQYSLCISGSIVLHLYVCLTVWSREIITSLLITWFKNETVGETWRKFYCLISAIHSSYTHSHLYSIPHVYLSCGFFKTLPKPHHTLYFWHAHNFSLQTLSMSCLQGSIWFPLCHVLSLGFTRKCVLCNWGKSSDGELFWLTMCVHVNEKFKLELCL